MITVHKLLKMLKIVKSYVWQTYQGLIEFEYNILSLIYFHFLLAEVAQ